MRRVLTTANMRAADDRTITSVGIPSDTLMENAGRASAERIRALVGSVAALRVCCLCGKGNNGGDALVVARHLHNAGASVAVRMVMGTDDLSVDAATNFKRLESLATETTRIKIDLGPGEISEVDVLVDGLLGTGLTKPLREPLSGVVEMANRSRAISVAMDVPTGINADSGEVMGVAVKSDLTVTMGALKLGLLIGDGPDYSGKVDVVDIGIPDSVVSEVCAEEPVFAAEDDDVIRLLPRRPRRAHKYSAGLALVVAGSPGLAGAPVMSSTAAARMGAGAVVCASPESISESLAARLVEVMTLPLPTSGNGISVEGGLAAMAERLSQARALLVGPGLGRSDTTGDFVRSLLASSSLPTVVDADGLYHLAGHTDLVTTSDASPLVLTPHLGELRRLAPDGFDPSNPVETARTFARRWNCVLVFKGSPTVVGIPEGDVYIATTGNQALATAGSGDVLAGMIVGLLAQGLAPRDAAVCALHVGGRAVENLAARVNRDSIMAMDIVRELPATLKRLTGT